MGTLAEGALHIASASSLDARPTIQPPREQMRLCRHSQRAGIGSRPPQYGAACQRIRRIDPSAGDDERIDHGITERRSSSSHAKAVRHDTFISREDMDPIGGTFELVICRFKGAGRPGEVKHLKPWENVEADRFHGRIIGKFDLAAKQSQVLACPRGGQAMSQPISVVVPVYDGVTQLDFTGPHQFLSRTPDLHVRVASLGGEPVTADRLTFSNLDDLAAIESCDVLLVPGGGGCLAAIENDLFVKEIARLGATARYLTSVCTGSLILGAAGFSTAAVRPATGHGGSCFRSSVPSWMRAALSGTAISCSGAASRPGSNFFLALSPGLPGP